MHISIHCQLPHRVAFLVAMVAASSVAWGGEAPADEPIYETEVRAYRIYPTDETTGFAETVDVGDAPPGMQTLDDTLADSVGIQTRQSGGKGTYSQVGIRGSSAKQVPIILDGVAIQTGGASGANLGDFSLDLLDTIEVYRGSVPLSVSTCGIGGAIRLTTRIPEYPVSSGALSLGSSGAKRLFLLQAVPIDAVDTLLVLSAEGYDGDFEFLNRNGTPLDPSDDRLERRVNNHHTGYSILSKTKWRVGDWTWTAAEDLMGKREGVPGTESLNFQDAHLQKLRSNTTVGASKGFDGRTELALRLNYLGAAETFNDPAEHVADPGDAPFSPNTMTRLERRTHTTKLNARFLYEWTPKQLTTIVVDDTFEAFRSREQRVTGDAPGIKMFRNTVTIGLGHDVTPLEPLILSPLVRGTFQSSFSKAGADPTGAGTLDSHTQSTNDASPALGVRYDVNDHIILKSNVGRYVRLPDLGELFGYSGAVKGNPELEKETGINSDIGFTVHFEPGNALTLLRLTGAAFGTWSRNLIVYEQNSQNVVWPVNAGRATILGVESDLSITMWRRLKLDGKYTFLSARDTSDDPTYNGKSLPGRPAHQVVGKIETTGALHDTEHTLWVDGDFRSESHLKRYNQPEYLVPGRLFIGVGYRFLLTEHRVSVTVKVDNILNKTTYETSAGDEVPLQDFWGFPLPGRSFYITFHWKI